MLKKWIYSLPLVGTSLLFSEANANTFLFAEALSLQLRESNATNWAQILTPNSPNETIQFLDIPFEWKTGFRVGAGYKADDKPWTATFYYTGYHTRGVNQASTDSAEIHSAFSSNFYANNPQGNGISGPYYHQAAISWDVLFDTLDLELGRTIEPSSFATLRPFVGLRGGRINQTIASYWQEPFEPTTSITQMPTPITSFSQARETITNDFKGIGPSMGLDTSFHLYSQNQQTFSLVGNVSGGFLWGNWTFSDVYENNTPQTIVTQSDSLSSSAFTVKTYLGVEWDKVIRESNWNVHLGYELQAWFNQLQYYSFDMGKTNDTLYLQGVVLGLGVLF